MHNPNSNSRRLREAIALVLFDIKMRYSGENIDTEKFRNEDNERLEKALLMAFDPFTNKNIMDTLVKHYKTEEMSLSLLHEYYKLPAMCLLRIKESIDMWEKEAGADGYFIFIEGYMGEEIKGSEMEYFVMTEKL